MEYGLFGVFGLCALHRRLAVRLCLSLLQRELKMSKTKVRLREMERGWYHAPEIREFDTREEAEAFVKDTNKDLGKEKNVPEWYMIAEIVS